MVTPSFAFSALTSSNAWSMVAFIMVVTVSLIFHCFIILFKPFPWFRHYVTPLCWPVIRSRDNYFKYEIVILCLAANCLYACLKMFDRLQSQLMATYYSCFKYDFFMFSSPILVRTFVSGSFERSSGFNRSCGIKWDYCIVCSDKTLWFLRINYPKLKIEKIDRYVDSD